MEKEVQLSRYIVTARLVEEGIIEWWLLTVYIKLIVGILKYMIVSYATDWK
jgi:hypothetical protein